METGELDPKSSPFAGVVQDLNESLLSKPFLRSRSGSGDPSLTPLRPSLASLGVSQPISYPTSPFSKTPTQLLPPPGGSPAPLRSSPYLSSNSNHLVTNYARALITKELQPPKGFAATSHHQLPPNGSRFPAQARCCITFWEL